MKGKTIAIDFDGTICAFSWPGIGPAIPDAIRVIRRLRAEGNTLILWTCREGQGLMQARLWLNEQGIGDCFATFNEHTELNLATFDNNCRKIAADIYIDDRALGVPKTMHGEVDWKAIERTLLPDIVDGCPCCEIPRERKRPILIGLCGKAGSGKSTAADMICTIAAIEGVKATRMSFAAPIREMAKRYFGWDGQKDERGRRLLQKIGTEVGREYNENVWIDYLVARANEQDGGLVVVDDVRFDNEARAIRNQGVTILMRGRALDLGANSSHASEAGVDPDLLTIAVDNSGDMASLEDQLSQIIRSLQL